MKCITEITKRDIKDLFRNGLEINEFEKREIKYINFWSDAMNPIKQ